MTTLRWPDGRGRFRDADSDRTPDGFDALEVGPGTTVDVDDPDTVEHYLDRGFERVDNQQAVPDPDADDLAGDQNDADGSDPDEQADDDAEPQADGGEDNFDAEAFTDRTPVSDVVDDIEAGDADGHLAAVADADGRVTVQRAVEDRQEAIGGE